jgi:twitching motility protein PilU
MIDHRNSTSQGHIVTIEDPVEYAHKSKRSLVTHREVGVDTQSWQKALKNALRQAPDVILIGEIRDMETMEQAIAFSETGHLCLSTLHANSASQTIERIINFFPEDRRQQLLLDLSANLRAIVAQRLVRAEDGKGRVAAFEILVNTPSIAQSIAKGEFAEIKPMMAKSRELGMRTFDWALFELYNDGLISYEEAIRNADSANELRLNIKLKSKRGEPAVSEFAGLSLNPMTQPADLEERAHKKMLDQQESRRKFEEEQLKQLKEKKRQAELAAAAATKQA